MTHTASKPAQPLGKPAPKQPRRVPAFAPVRSRARKDGWHPVRQAEFIGALAETGSVRAAARRVGMARESAYRLRGREGAEGFAAAWDAALVIEHGLQVPMVTKWPIAPKWKVTTAEVRQRALVGLVRPVMHAGRCVGVVHKPDNTALLRLVGWFARAGAWRCDEAGPGRGNGRTRNNAKPQKRQPATERPAAVAERS